MILFLHLLITVFHWLSKHQHSKILHCRSYFQLSSRCLEIVMKCYLLCLIHVYYITCYIGTPCHLWPPNGTFFHLKISPDSPTCIMRASLKHISDFFIPLVLLLWNMVCCYLINCWAWKMSCIKWLEDCL